MPRATPAKLDIREARPKDIPGILKLIETVYPGWDSYTTGMIRGQINNFPEGQFVAVYEGEIVGYCASLRIDEELGQRPTTNTENVAGRA